MSSMQPTAKYPVSRDYSKLVDLIHKTSVVCFVDYEGKFRDVCESMVMPHGDGFYLSLGARGTTYVCGFDADEFIALCEKNNVEFIEPQE